MSDGTLYSLLFVSSALALALSAFSVSTVKDRFTAIGLMRVNYRGSSIPTAYGIGVLGSAAAAMLLSVSPAFWTRELMAFWAAAGIAGAFGLFDDLKGSQTDKGMKGHAKALLEGRLTTGALKAIGIWWGGALAGVVAFGPGPRAFFCALLVALWANALNLLDTRPGRAAKGFLIMALFLTISGALAGGRAGSWISGLVVLTLAQLVYIKSDFRGQIMMGDSGANGLGAAIGFGLSAALSLQWQVLAIAFVSVLHIYSERKSLGDLIDSTPILSFIDRLGRPEGNR